MTLGRFASKPWGLSWGAAVALCFSFSSTEAFALPLPKVKPAALATHVGAWLGAGTALEGARLLSNQPLDWGTTFWSGWGGLVSARAGIDVARTASKKGLGAALREHAVELGSGLLLDGIALANHPVIQAHPLLGLGAHALTAAGTAVAAVSVVDAVLAVRRRAMSSTSRSGRRAQGAASFVADVRGAMADIHAEFELIKAAQARLDSGKQPTLVQRRGLAKLLSDADSKVATAQENLTRPLETYEGKSGSLLWGGGLLRAVDRRNKIEAASGLGSAAERKERIDDAYARVFSRVEDDINSLSDPELRIDEGAGAQRVDQFAWYTLAAIGGDGPLYGSRQGLKELYARARQAGALAGRHTFARWAVADHKLAELEKRIRALPQSPAEQSLTALERSNLERRVEQAAQEEAFLRTREPKEQMGDLAPDDLLARLKAGETAEWQAALKPDDGTWNSQVTKGLKLSFGRSYERALTTIRHTLGHGNPLDVQPGFEALAQLRARLAQAADLGVTLDGPGERREQLRKSVTSESLAELESRLVSLKGQAPALKEPLPPR